MTERRTDEKSAAPRYPMETIRALIDGKLDWPALKAMMSSFKDPDRFDKYVEVLQERVPWKEKIVLPIHEHLYVVAKKGKLIVKAVCGQEYGDYRANWKMKALIYVRDSEEKYKELYPGIPEELRMPDTKWSHLREYYCPRCGSLLQVEYVVPGYPVVHDFLPDIEGFYQKWLGRPVPVA
jgi:acetone carboxylase gamma subunit